MESLVFSCKPHFPCPPVTLPLSDYTKRVLASAVIDCPITSLFDTPQSCPKRLIFRQYYFAYPYKENAFRMDASDNCTPAGESVRIRTLHSTSVRLTIGEIDSNQLPLATRMRRDQPHQKRLDARSHECHRENIGDRNFSESNATKRRDITVQRQPIRLADGTSIRGRSCLRHCRSSC